MKYPLENGFDPAIPGVHILYVHMQGTDRDMNLCWLSTYLR